MMIATTMIMRTMTTKISIEQTYNLFRDVSSKYRYESNQLKRHKLHSQLLKLQLFSDVMLQTRRNSLNEDEIMMLERISKLKLVH